MSFSIPNTFNTAAPGKSPFGIEHSRHGYSHSLGSLSTGIVNNRELEVAPARQIPISVVPTSNPSPSEPKKLLDDNSVLDQPRETPTRRGICKFFNSQKGFGFVIDSNSEELGSQEVFVHYTAIQSRSGFRSLAEGEEVEYELTTGAKGYQAVRLTGPNGRPVMGDPKARLQKPGPFMQLAPIAFQSPYGIDPYMQQHPGMFGSPYNTHVVYVPTNISMHPGAQHGQFAQMIAPNQFSPQQMNAFNPNLNLNTRGADIQSNMPNFAPSSAGTFGPVGGVGNPGISPFGFASHSSQSPFVSNPALSPGNANGSRLNGAASRNFAPSGRGNGATPNFLGEMNGDAKNGDFSHLTGLNAFGNNGTSNFFGNLLYSSSE